METEIEKKIREILKTVKEKKLYPEIKIVEEGIASSSEFKINGKKFLSFASSNCLGLANSKEIKESIIKGLYQYGISQVAPYHTCGTLEIHKKLEKEIADFLNMEDAMIFNTSTMANMGVIPALVNLPSSTFFSFLKIPFKSREETVLFSDEFNHATVIEGCRLAKGEKIVYKHCDMNDLENKLKKYKRKKRKLILSDGVFSMDGDITPLKDIVFLARKYGAMVFIDDACATGILGENGRGTMEYYGLKSGVDVIVTTFSKAIGMIGGVACASKEIIDYLKISAKTHMFSVAFPAALALGVLKALEIIRKDKERRRRLWENTKYFKTKLQEAGFNTLNSQTPIIPVLIGDENTAIRISNELFNRGIFCPAIYWPAVPKGKARFRFIVSSEHTKDQMDRLIENLVDLGKKYKIIK
jgi:8-amino-7-oxononanoate synthase